MPVLVKIAAGLAAVCVMLSLIDMVEWFEPNRPFAYYTFYALTILADAVCCAAICLCCVWCLNTKGTKPWPWLSIVLAVVGIPLSIWALERNHLTGLYMILLIPHGGLKKAVSLPRFLSLAADKGCLLHVLTKLACVAAAVLGPLSIFLYQRRQNKRPK